MDAPLAQVLPSAELGEQEIRRLTVGGTDMLLTRLGDGRVVAFATRCPHQKTALEGATLLGDGIQCPLHGYVYDLGTGENDFPARTAAPDELWTLRPGYLPLYPVEERDGWIWVGPEPQPPPAAYDPELETPPPPPAQPAEHPTKVLRVAPGATFGLRLPTTPRPGFAWRVETSGPLLAVVEERFEGGERPTHLIRVAARGEGRATLKCLYARPWDTKPAELRTYEVRIEF